MLCTSKYNVDLNRICKSSTHVCICIIYPADF